MNFKIKKINTMDLKQLKEITNSEVPDNIKEQLIISLLAIDENVIPSILNILKQERINKNELIIDMNLELSRAHCYIDMRPESKDENKERFNKNFVVDEIAKFYFKYKGMVSHCFNRFNF